MGLKCIFMRVSHVIWGSSEGGTELTHGETSAAARGRGGGGGGTGATAVDLATKQKAGKAIVALERLRCAAAPLCAVYSGLPAAACLVVGIIKGEAALQLASLGCDEVGGGGHNSLAGGEDCGEADGQEGKHKAAYKQAERGRNGML